jgi:4-hydroxybenzoyl-CoA reductase subunit beta
MLRLPDFEYEEPDTITDAAELLADHGRSAMAVAGGTDVFPKMKRRQMRPDVVVSLQRVDGLDDGLREVRETDEGLRIGALTTLADVADHPTVRADYPAVADAVASVATPHHRRMGTIGGNLCQDTRCYYYDQQLDWRKGQGWCRKAPGPEGWPPDEEAMEEIPCRTVPGSGRCWAIFASDSAPALIAHGAEVTVAGPDGERTLPLAAFYEDEGIDPRRLGPDELLTAVSLPPADGLESTYLKYSQRESFDFPSLGVAAAVAQAADGTVERASVVLGAVSTRPLSVDAAADVLVGERPDDDRVDEVAAAAKRVAQPMDNDDVSPAHRNQLVPVYTRRALDRLLEGWTSDAR